MRSETDEMIHIPQSMPRRLFDSVAAGRQVRKYHVSTRLQRVQVVTIVKPLIITSAQCTVKACFTNILPGMLDKTLNTLICVWI